MSVPTDPNEACESNQRKKSKLGKDVPALTKDHDYSIQQKVSNNEPFEDEKEEEYQCCRCKETFIDSKDIENHYVAKHLAIVKNILTRKKEVPKVSNEEIIRTHQCPTCKRKFKLLKYLQSHIDFSHGGSNHQSFDYKCYACDKQFKFQIDLDSHVDVSHGLGHPLKTNIQWYKCTKCNLRFPSQKDYDKHQAIKHKVVKCTICQQVVFLFFYPRHKLVKHGEKPDQPLECSKCNKAYKSIEALDKHKANVHKKKNTLDKSDDNLKDPLEQETLEKSVEKGSTPEDQALMFLGNIKCSQCNDVFANPDDLNKHFNAEHGIVKKVVNKQPRFILPKPINEPHEILPD